MSLDEVKKHLGSRHDQSSHGKGGSKPSVSGSGNVMSGLESIAGRKFNPEAAKTIGDRTSNVMNVSVPKGTKPGAMQKQFDKFFNEKGMKKVPGRTKSETVYGTSDNSTVARLKKRSVKMRGRPPIHSFLLEVINQN